MAFALSIRNTVSEVRQIFFTTTCLIAIATVIFNGGMTVPILTLLKVKAFRDETIKGVMVMSTEFDDFMFYLCHVECKTVSFYFRFQSVYLTRNKRR